MIDRRYYQRVGIGIKCVIFSDKTPYEWTGRLYDISESGIRLCLDKDNDISKLEVGNLIAFQGVDEYSYLLSCKSKRVVVQGVARITRLSKLEIGAELFEPSSLLQQYISERKVASWLHDDLTITSV